MANDKDEITFQLVLATAEQAARDRGVTVLEVTNREIKSILNRKNDGYIGAHLQTVKIEYARAKLLEEKQISHHFNAALYDEIKRHVDNARGVAQAEAEVTKQMFIEICESNNALEQSLADKNKELTEVQRDHADVVQNMKDDLNATQREKSALEIRLKDALDRLERTDKELGSVREKLALASAELGHVTKERDELQGASAVQKDRLLELEKELNQSFGEVKKAEQRAELLSLRNDDIARENDALSERLNEMMERAATAEAQLKANSASPSLKTSAKSARKSATTASKR